MNNINLTIPQDILDFLDVVISKTKGYHVYLGGGYLRDIYYNQVVNVATGRISDMKKVPKDLDIFFVPTLSDTSRELPTIVKSYVNYDTLAEDIPDMEERGVAKVRGLYMPNISTRDVQFIAYDKNFESALELAADMDMNINQIMYNPITKEFIATDEFLVGHNNKVIECLHQFDEVRMYNRYQRMIAKFPDYFVETTLDMDYYKYQLAKNPKRSGTSSMSMID
jgi:hypothetical protein